MEHLLSSEKSKTATLSQKLAASYASENEHLHLKTDVARLERQLTAERSKVSDRDETIRLMQEAAKESRAVMLAAEKEHSKIDLIYNSVLSIPNEVISADTKAKIKHLYKVFVASKRYPHLSPLFESGLSAYQDMVEAAVAYLNGRINEDVFRAKLTASNYKGSLDVLVKRILQACCGYSSLLTDREFTLGAFLDTYLNTQITTSPRYKQLVENYKKNRDFAKPISPLLARHMTTMNAITSVCNHDKNFSNNSDINRHYQETVQRFLCTKSPEYYEIFSSYFAFIEMYADAETLLFQLK